MEAEDDDEAEDRIREVGTQPESENDLELALDAVKGFITVHLFEEAGVILAACVVLRTDIHCREKGAHGYKDDAVNQLTPDQLLLVVLIHFLS